MSIYTAGSLCFSGSSAIQEPATSSGGTITVYVGGKLASKNESVFVGTAAKPVKSITAVGNCYDQNHSQIIPGGCSHTGSPLSNINQPGYGSGVYALAYSQTQATVAKPTIDPNWYTNAAPGPNHPCNTSGANVSTYPSASVSGTPQWSQSTFVHTLFDNDTTRNTSLPATQGLSGGKVDPFELVNRSGSGQKQNSFDCRYYDAGGNLIGRLAFAYPASGSMAPGNPGILTISGTVFIDGNLDLQSNDYVLYQGIGTIYVNGTVSFENGANLCAKPTSGSPCVGNFDATQNLLEIVAVNAGNAATGWNMSGSGTYEGIAYTNGAFNGGNGAQMNGPVVADTAQMSGSMSLQSTFNPPAGAPGAATTSTTTTTGPDQVTLVTNPGSWQQLG